MAVVAVHTAFNSPMDASALAAWYAAALSTLTVAAAGVGRWRASRSSLDVTVSREFEDDEWEVLAVFAVNRSSHPVQIVHCGLIDENGQSVALRLTPKTLPRSLEPREAARFAILWEDAPIRGDVPTVAWVRLATGHRFQSRSTLLG